VDIDGEPWADPPCMGAESSGGARPSDRWPYRSRRPIVTSGSVFSCGLWLTITDQVLATVWDFGDGTVVSNAAYLRHGWSGPGLYTVTLTGL